VVAVVCGLQVSASVFDSLPKHTDGSSYDGLGWTPAPTDARLAVGLPAELRFRRRGNPATCGYASGQANNPQTCISAGAYCLKNKQSSYFDCCLVDSNGDAYNCHISNPPKSCYDYNRASECVGSCTQTNFVCSSNFPYCQSNLLFGTTAGDTETYTNLGCGSVPTVVDIYPEYFSPSNTNPITPVTSVTPVTTTLPFTTSPSISPLPISNSHKSNIGAIVGGVVGGVVVLVLIVAGVIVCLVRRKRAQRQSAISEVSQSFVPSGK